MDWHDDGEDAPAPLLHTAVWLLGPLAVTAALFVVAVYSAPDSPSYIQSWCVITGRLSDGTAPRGRPSLVRACGPIVAAACVLGVTTSILMHQMSVLYHQWWNMPIYFTGIVMFAYMLALQPFSTHFDHPHDRAPKGAVDAHGFLRALPAAPLRTPVACRPAKLTRSVVALARQALLQAPPECAVADRMRRVAPALHSFMETGHIPDADDCANLAVCSPASVDGLATVLAGVLCGAAPAVVPFDMPAPRRAEAVVQSGAHTVVTDETTCAAVQRLLDVVDASVVALRRVVVFGGACARSAGAGAGASTAATTPLQVLPFDELLREYGHGRPPAFEFPALPPDADVLWTVDRLPKAPGKRHRNDPILTVRTCMSVAQLNSRVAAMRTMLPGKRRDAPPDTVAVVSSSPITAALVVSALCYLVDGGSLEVLHSGALVPGGPHPQRASSPHRPTVILAGQQQLQTVDRRLTAWTAALPWLLRTVVARGMHHKLAALHMCADSAAWDYALFARLREAQHVLHVRLVLAVGRSGMCHAAQWRLRCMWGCPVVKVLDAPAGVGGVAAVQDATCRGGHCSGPPLPGVELKEEHGNVLGRRRVPFMRGEPAREPDQWLPVALSAHFTPDGCVGLDARWAPQPRIGPAPAASPF